MTSNAPYKPSPLSFGSQRASPFRRQSSPVSPPTTLRPNTPGSSPGKGHTPVQSPSKLNQSYTAEDEDVLVGEDAPIAAPKFREPPSSPTRGANSRGSFSMTGFHSSRPMLVDSDALTRLPPAQLREMREAFQVLDRDNDGSVNRDDVADVLSNLGQDSSPSATLPYFLPGTSQTLNLPTFLKTLSTLLAPFSSQKELLNAFSAFDDDDTGQIDVSELRDALLHTSPETGESLLTEREVDDVMNGFTGRRTFGGKAARSAGLGGGLKRAEVFRYQEFVNSVMGTDGANAGASTEKGTTQD
ncbi:hypothetical protein Egran_02741 [Elaphomyces granulatus]|uniref:EF-hand domain-containing protein n=1 Tax=Elaphomyces granulatus TaxID=519963 RepID=A0A232LZJ3_9EURO|nr:hypothetical protein Egran_02741 [Elaphomyces granulatus]